MNTYCPGYKIFSTKNITKNDIITLCDLLNDKYENDISKCYFEPEPIAEGGIIFRFPDNPNWYKSVRIYFENGGIFSWPWVEENFMDDWRNNNTIIFNSGVRTCTNLKSFHGAPSFTIDELKIWEECFNQIGFVRKGRYPSKKDLLPQK